MLAISKTRRISLAVLLVLGWIAYCTPVWAQGAGNNGVYNPFLALSASASYIDASAFTTTPSDICNRIHAALSTIPAGKAAVIDARGITTGLTCPVAKTPWIYGTTVTSPATILLPAATILLNTGWTVPSLTRIIGEGGGLNSSGTAGVTTIRACTSGTPSCSQNLPGAVISMGNATGTFCPLNASSQPICIGISVENLWIDAQGLAATGIVNNYSQELSYVKHVTLYQIAGSGLSVAPGTSGGTAQDSGPYVDISCIVNLGAAAGTTCARILNVSTRGIHGMKCINSSATIPTNAIAIDGPNNTVEDVSVQGFTNGVRLGASADAPDNLVKNIIGGSGVTSVVLITNITGITVQDIVVLGVGNGGNASSKTISDNRTSPATSLTDANVAMYVLGEPMTSSGTTIGYSRFTTSPNVTTWAHGSIVPAGSCKNGGLYSDTNGGMPLHPFAWYVCSQSVWSGVK